MLFVAMVTPFELLNPIVESVVVCTLLIELIILCLLSCLPNSRLVAVVFVCWKCFTMQDTVRYKNSYRTSIACENVWCCFLIHFLLLFAVCWDSTSLYFCLFLRGHLCCSTCGMLSRIAYQPLFYRQKFWKSETCCSPCRYFSLCDTCI